MRARIAFSRALGTRCIENPDVVNPLVRGWVCVGVAATESSAVAVSVTVPPSLRYCLAASTDACKAATSRVLSSTQSTGSSLAVPLRTA
jgi:hypothetical protein